MTAVRAQSVVILGGGPAGLTAAYRLTGQGYRVTIVDRRPSMEASPGSETHEPFTVLGCHRATETLLRSLHPESQQPARSDISLEFQLSDGSRARYPRTWLPAPLHTWVSLLRFAGMPWRERWRLVSRLERIWERDERLPDDLEQRTADEWLTAIGQSPSTCRAIWNPLAQWLTGNDLSTLSADAFVSSITPLFLGSPQHNRIAVLQDSIDKAFIRPIAEILTQHGGTFVHNVDATQLRYEQERVSGVLLRDGSLLQADWYIAAIPPQQLTPLLPERWLTRYAYFQQLAELSSIDKTVVHITALQTCPTSRLVLLGGTGFHSVFASAAGPDRTDFSLITTGNQYAPTPSNPDLESTIHDMLRSSGLLLPHSTIVSTRQHRVHNAFLSLRPGAKLHRPIQRSPIANLLVAGAWTDTGWPPNLESAIISGNRCAEALVRN